LKLAIRHTTHYEFSEPVKHGLQRLRLRPKPSHGQHILEWDMQFDGLHQELEYEDQHFNHVTLVSVEPETTSVTITCKGLVETADHAGVIGHHSGFLPLWHFKRQTDLTRPGAAMKALVSDLAADREDTLACLHALSRSVLDAVTYEIGLTDVDTPGEAALEAGHGVCQDHTHIFIGAARMMDIPARYVSGYLMMDDRTDQEAGHGWAEAHIKGLGWVGFDISNGISPDSRYVRVATGRDYREAAPVTGLCYGSGESELRVLLEVEQQLSEQ